MTIPTEQTIPAEAKSKGEGSVPPVPAQVLDIRRDTCPMTFVRTRLALDRLQPGQTLLVRVQGAEASRSVPEQAAALGHAILARTATGDATDLLIRRA